MTKNDFQYARWNSYTLQCGTIMTLISSGDCTLQCGMWLWNCDSKFTKMAAPCNVIRGSGMTCYWIRPVAVPCNVTRSSGIMTLNSPGGSTLQCSRWLRDDMPLNSHKRPPYWKFTSGFDFNQHHCSRHVILHQSPKFYPNQTTHGRKKWRHVNIQDGGSQPSWILGV